MNLIQCIPVYSVCAVYSDVQWCGEQPRPSYAPTVHFLDSHSSLLFCKLECLIEVYHLLYFTLLLYSTFSAFRCLDMQIAVIVQWLSTIFCTVTSAQICSLGATGPRLVVGLTPGFVLSVLYNVLTVLVSSRRYLFKRILILTVFALLFIIYISWSIFSLWSSISLTVSCRFLDIFF